ncbi:MAG TPA: DUF2255 family protein [Acidimicrobiia bacterium]|nr:DUF2255 family protein [Acidimicrobiia bacterium]
MSLTADQRAAIDTTEEVDIYTSAGGRMIGTIIWVVVSEGEVYVRSVNAEDGQWYQRARSNPSVSLDVNGERIDFQAVHIGDDATIEAVSDALRAKYRPGASLDAMVRDEVLGHTLRLDPVD